MSQQITTLDLALLVAHPDNPRESLGDLTDLAVSIRAHGLLAPVVVVPGDVRQDGDRDVRTYLLLAGHRRVAAARLAGLDSVPAIVRDDLDEAGQTEVMLVENVQRADLTPMEQAKGLQRLADLGLTQRQIAERTGIAQGTVSKRLALLNLPSSVAKAVDSGGISVKDAEALAALAKQDQGGKVVQAAARFVQEGRKGDDAVKEAKAQAVKDAKIAAAHEDGKRAGATPPDAKQAARLHNLPTVTAKDVGRHAGHLLYKVDAWNGDLKFYCGKPTAHPKPKAEQDAAAAERAAKDKQQADLAAAKQEQEQGALQRQALALAVLGKWDARKCEAYVTAYNLSRYGVGAETFVPGGVVDPLRWALDVVGVEGTDAVKDATDWLPKQKPVTVARFSVLVCLGEQESDLRDALARRKGMPVQSARFGTYFDLLGYEPKASEWLPMRAADEPPADEPPADEPPADDQGGDDQGDEQQ